jgi:hypothetical protein
MWAARRHARALVLPVITAVVTLTATRAAAQTPPVPTAGATRLAAAQAAQAPPAAPRVTEPVRKRTLSTTDHAATLLQIEALVNRMAISSELVPSDAQELTRTLVVARGRTIETASLKALATHFALAVTAGSFDDESIERLAQDLFAAVNSRELTSRESGLLVADVSTLLKDAGVDGPAIDAVVTAFGAISPAGVDRLDPPAPRTGGLLVLTRQ